MIQRLSLKSALICMVLFTSLWAQFTTPGRYYPESPKDSVLKFIDCMNANRTQQQKWYLDSLRKVQQDEFEARSEENQDFLADMESLKIPPSLDNFKTLFHLPPVAQYNSGMCWCYCGTSFFESEVNRLNGDKIKLSELYTVYWEYVEKARRYIRRHGDSYFAEGSETEALFDIWKKYGVVPASNYKGYLGDDSLHNHEALFDELNDYLAYLKTYEIWNEDQAIDYIKSILNKHLGTPPTEFIYKGKKITPQIFFKTVLKLNFDDYIAVQSTSSLPFYSYGIFNVPDNWRRSEIYYNLPLDEFYSVIQRAIHQGYSLAIGGDVSEPGYRGEYDAAIIPSFDIPAERIDQDARELRIDNGATVDDHGIHVVGYTSYENQDWFLIKDSGRGSRKGKFKGYYMYHKDYIRLKMLTYLIHKDCLKGSIK